MPANSRLKVICTTEKPVRRGLSPDPAEAHRLLQAFWRIKDPRARARLLQEAETAAAANAE
jgi:hypothetical protein